MTALVIVAALTSSAPPSEAQTRIEQRARSEVNELFGAICPGRCVVLAVQARIDEEPVEVNPGFEPVAPVERLAVVRSVFADVLVDLELPEELRAQLKSLVARRLRSISPSAKVEVLAIRFPPPRDSPAAPPPPPAATAAIPPGPVASPPATIEERLTDRFVEKAPEVLIAAMLAIAALAAALALARPGPAPAPPRLAEALTAAAAPAEASFDPERRARLLRLLADERTARNAVVREALARCEGELVMAWAREVGDVLLEDLRGDPELGGSAAALSRRSAQAAVNSDTALHELELRLLSATLSVPRGTAERAFGFLEAVRPEQFCAAWRGLSEGAQQASLRFAPAPLKAALLESLGPGERDRLAFAWAGKPALSTDEAAAAAAELRREVERAEGAASARGAIESLLSVMSMAEQDELLARLRAKGAGPPGPVVVESTLVSAPVEALTSALLELAPAELAPSLGGASPALRARLIAACPKALRQEIEEELRLSGEVPRERFLAARRALLRRLEEELKRRGVQQPPPSGRIHASAS